MGALARAVLGALQATASLLRVCAVLAVIVAVFVPREIEGVEALEDLPSLNLLLAAGAAAAWILARVLGWVRYRVRRAVYLSQKGKGRRVVLTGAASGVGHKTAHLFLRRGWRVIAIDVNEAGLQKLKEEASDIDANALGLRNIEEDGDYLASADCSYGELSTFTVDLSNEAACEDFADKILRDEGIRKNGLDCLVNCAAMPLIGATLSPSIKMLNLQLGVNLAGPLRLCRLFRDALLRGPKGGNIVNVSSFSGTVAWPFQGAYAASKFGMEGFSDSIRREVTLAKLPLRITLVKPGGIATPFAFNQIEASLKWAGEHPDDPFASTFEAKVNRQAKAQRGASEKTLNNPLLLSTAQSVADCIYINAVDPNPPAREWVLSPFFRVLVPLARYSIFKNYIFKYM